MDDDGSTDIINKLFKKKLSKPTNITKYKTYYKVYNTTKRQLKIWYSIQINTTSNKRGYNLGI